jgi:hypothetical protein
MPRRGLGAAKPLLSVAASPLKLVTIKICRRSANRSGGFLFSKGRAKRVLNPWIYLRAG